MDKTTLLALAALIVSILALPISYFVATEQVKVGLDEFERRLKDRTRLLVADRLNEFISLFFSATKAIAGIDLTDGNQDQQKLQTHIEKIDNAVIKTGILNRLATSIDEYVVTGDAGLNQDIATRLNMVRGMAHRGSIPPENYATWDIVNLCRGTELESLLREKHD